MRLSTTFWALLLAASTAQAQASATDVDRGSYIIYVKDRAVGAETFGIETRLDSLNAFARAVRTLRTDRGDETHEKQMVLTMGRADFLVRYYQANETFRGETKTKGVVASEGDTAFTIFQEVKGGGGVADRLVAPPGRMYLLDSGLFTLFNLICLHLHDKSFSSRPVTLLTLGARDTVVEAEATNLGIETIRWGARPVQARKLMLKERDVVFVAWMNPAGKMLRLTHEASGLRVERDAPPVKRKAAPAPKRGG